VPINTIFLDAGGTIVWPNWQRVSTALAAEGVNVDATVLAAVDPHVRRSFDMAPVIPTATNQRRDWSYWQYFEAILGRSGIEADTAARRALSVLEQYHRTTNLWETIPAFVPETLAELRRLGYKLVVVSNSNGTVRQTFDRIGLSGLIDVVIDSGDERIEKPDPRLFEIALERAGATAAATVHVGDFYCFDVIGARAAGLLPVLIDEANLYADADCHRVASIAELPRLLERI
jgi:HAD superfamily hydrolase (TIGR01549 family)